MASFPKIPFLFIFLISALLVNAQNLTIHVGPLAHADLVKSMVCVSDADGKSYFEYILTPDEIEYGSEFQATVPDPQHYCFSIINEYQIDTINSGNPFYWAKTYYDQSDDLLIIKFDHPNIPEHFRDISSSITIRNAPVIEDWQHNTFATISNFKQTGSDIRTQSNFWPTEDLFVFMKAENDKQYRYLYVPQEEINIVNNVVSPYNSLQFDWKTLRTDLQHLRIFLPFKTPFRGEIKATNPNHNKSCILYRSNSLVQDVIPSGIGLKAAPSLIPEEGVLDLYIPNEPLTDYQAFLSWGHWRKNISYSYRIHHGNELKFPFFNESVFIPEYLSNDSLGFHTQMNPYPKYFRIFYRRASMDEFPQLGSKLHQGFESNWIVVGKNRGPIQFRLPLISPESLSQFESMGRWFYEHFENVVFLEKDTNIDWINFFHDYNVLLVSYKDPFQ